MMHKTYKTSIDNILLGSYYMYWFYYTCYFDFWWIILFMIVFCLLIKGCVIPIKNLTILVEPT